MWHPPSRASTNLVAGVDPPGAYAIWEAKGIIAWDQQPEAFTASASYRRARRVHDLARRFNYCATVERPYGATNNVPEVIQNAMSTGWWLCETHNHSNLQWNPAAGGWRAHVGIHGDRAQCKAQAIRTAQFLAKLQGIDPPMTKEGRPAEHASESWCMCLATWLRFGLVVKDDLAHRFIMAIGLDYKGGVPPGDYGKRDALASGHAIRHKPHHRKRMVKAVNPPKEDPHDNPFGATEDPPGGWTPNHDDTEGQGGADDGDVLPGSTVERA